MAHVNYEAIPRTLTQLPQWLVWRLEDRKGKPSKIPYSARSGGHAKSNDPATWCDFNRAGQAARRGDYDGVGFAFNAGDGLCGVDLDKCIDADTGELEPWADEVLQRFLGTYIEISPSGKGLRIFAHGEARRCGKGTEEKRIELYDHTSPRYLTVTGHWWSGSNTDIAAMQPELDWLHERFFFVRPSSPHPSAARQPEPQNLALSDAELLERAQRNAEFAALWAGQWESKYPSQSEADAALAARLAFWCRRDVEQMERLFRASALMRPKFDRRIRSDGPTYGRQTLERAAEKCSEIYKPAGERPRPQPVAEKGGPHPSPRPGGEGTNAAVSSGGLGAGSADGGGDEQGGPPADEWDEEDCRPDVKIGGDRLVSAMQRAEQILFAEQEPPFYTRGGVLTRIGYNDQVRERQSERVLIRGVLALQIVTPGWLRRRMMQSCRFVSWSAKKDDWQPVNLPKDYAESYIEGGEWWAPVLRSVIHAPIVRPDGSILSKPGYCPSSGLYLDSAEKWKLPPERKKGETINPAADKAIQWAKDQFVELFEPFSPESWEDLAVLVAAVLTGLMKTEIGPAPGIVITAPVFGSGKGKLADIISIIVTGHATPMLTWPRDGRGKGDEGEFKKMLFSMQLAGARIICIDEVKDRLVSSALDSALTQEETTDRVLSQSKMATVRPADSLYLALGNNISVPADSSRRWLRGYLNPNCADPHLRSFDRDAIQHAHEHRIKLVCAALTLLHGYIHAGKPDMGCRLGSFERWAALVPSALVWAGMGNPIKTLEAWRELDQGRGLLGAMMDAWYERFKAVDEEATEPLTAGEVTSKMTLEATDPATEQLAGVLREICGEAKGYNNRRLGNYLLKEAKRVIEAYHDGGGGQPPEKRYFRIEPAGKHQGSTRWKVIRVPA